MKVADLNEQNLPEYNSHMDVPRLSGLVVETAGRNWLTACLLQRGFEVAIPEVDQGIDLVVFKEDKPKGFRAIALQLKCATNQCFVFERKYEDRAIIHAHIWDVFSKPVVFFFTFQEGLGILGERHATTNSWTKDKGGWVETRVPKAMRERMEPYRERWEWFAAQFEKVT